VVSCAVRVRLFLEEEVNSQCIASSSTLNEGEERGLRSCLVVVEHARLIIQLLSLCGRHRQTVPSDDDVLSGLGAKKLSVCWC